MTRNNRGSALVLVIFVLAILMALAVPLAFYFSNIYRKAAGFESRVKAAVAAEGAVDHALAYAYLTAEGNERNYNQPAPYNTPDYDTWNEFGVDFSFKLYPELSQVFSSAGITFQDPASLIWHAAIEDEQGKININSATPQLLGNLIGSATLTEPLRREDLVIHIDNGDYFRVDDDPDTLDGTVRVGWEEISYRHATSFTLEGLVRENDPGQQTFHRAGTLVYDSRADRVASGVCDGKEYLPYASTLETAYYLGCHDCRRLEALTTVFSAQEGASGWQRREGVLHQGLTEDTSSVTVTNSSGLGNGAVIRVLLNGEVIFVSRVSWARQRNGTGAVSLGRELGLDVLDRDELVIEGRLPHPVNINTATTPVLYALFKGVGIKGTSEVVSHPEAEALALEAAGTYFTGPASFKSFLEDMRAKGIISRADAEALYINATEAYSPSLRVVTLPFTYRSLGQVTLIGRTVSSNRFGQMLGRRAIRQTVSVPAEGSGEWGLSSQADFQTQLDSSNSPGVATWPEPVAAGRAPDERGLDVETLEDPFGDVRLKSLRDERPLRNAKLTEHFEKEGPYDLTPDGADLTKGGTLAYDTNTCLTEGGGHFRPLYFSAWVKVPAWDIRRRYLFSAGVSPDTDRLSFFFDGRTRKLVLEAAGPDLQTGCSSFSLPFDPEPDTWYHLSARLSGDRPGDALIYVDGQQPDPLLFDYEPGARLETATGAADTQMTLDDASFLDEDGGTVQIGQEIIEYESLSNNTLVNIRRGTRYSYREPHPKDSLVIPFGYSNRLAGPLPKGGETLVGDVAANPSTRLSGEVDAGDTTIPVNDTEGFPPSGFIRVGSENMYYRGLTATSFTGVARGELNTTARSHRVNSWIQSLSLQISGPGDYRSGEHISLNAETGDSVEWVYVPRIVSRDGNTHIVRNVRANGTPTGGWRGEKGTTALRHADGTRVIPVTRMQGPQCGDRSSPIGETITVIEGNSREQARIKRAYARYSPHTRADGSIYYTHEFLVSLYDFTLRAYAASSARFIRQPSGEMPVNLPSQTYVFGERPGSSELMGLVDELRFGSSLSPSGVIPPDQGVNAGDAVIPVLENYCNWSGGAPNPSPRDSGLVRIGSEYVFYRSFNSDSFALNWGDEDEYARKRDTRNVVRYVLQDCIRGALGSGRSMHKPGEPVQFLDEFPVSLLVSDILRGNDTFSLLDGSQFPESGYLLALDNTPEVVGWTQKNGTSFSGSENIRGAFGTPAARHAAGIICRLLPVRYHSRYKREYDGPELVYFSGSRSVKEAVWTSFSYTTSESAEGGPAHSLRIRPVLRFSEETGWEEKPLNSGDSLYEFTRDGVNPLPRVRSDRVQFRFYYEYLPGAFNGNGWKSTMKLNNVFLEYATVPVVRRVDVTER